MLVLLFLNILIEGAQLAHFLVFVPVEVETILSALPDLRQVVV